MQAAIHHRDLDPAASRGNFFNTERSNVTTATTGLRFGASGLRPELRRSNYGFMVNETFSGP
jgi:hypothetical protein